MFDPVSGAPEPALALTTYPCSSTTFAARRSAGGGRTKKVHQFPQLLARQDPGSHQPGPESSPFITWRQVPHPAQWNDSRQRMQPQPCAEFSHHRARFAISTSSRLHKEATAVAAAKHQAHGICLARHFAPTPTSSTCTAAQHPRLWFRWLGRIALRTHNAMPCLHASTARSPPVPVCAVQLADGLCRIVVRLKRHKAKA